ncbi:MAG: glycosyltransferase family 39 protein [Kiritimatiellales bacterium]|nr:glycosyltransferase family 39 protein [Kiritimatiellales bacterium]
MTRFRAGLEHLNARTCFLALVLFSLMMYGTALNARHLWKPDEPRVAGIAREMLLTGEWVEPRLNGSPFLEKPPLYFWLDALSIKAFGTTPLAAKLPSAAAAVVGILAVYGAMRFMRYSAFTSALAGVVLATSAQYWRNGRKCLVDMLVCMFITVAMAALLPLLKKEKVRQKILFWILFIAALAGALFSKGLAGVAIPCVAIFFILIYHDGVRRKITYPNWLLIGMGVLLAFIPVSIWLWKLYLHSGWDAFYTVTWINNIGRFTGTQVDHAAPFYYYLKKLPETGQPWTVLLPVAVFYHLRLVKQNQPGRFHSVFMLCWFLMPLLLLSAASGKRIIYLLPLFPPAAMLIASMAGPILEGSLTFSFSEKLDRGLERLLHGFVFVPLLVALAFAAAGLWFHLPILIVLFMAVAGSLVTAVLLRLWHDMNGPAYFTVLLFAVGGLFITFEQMLFSLDNETDSFRPIFQQCDKILQGDGQRKLYLFRPGERVSGGAVFYMGTLASVIQEDAELAGIFAGSPDRVLVLAEESLLRNFDNIEVAGEATIGKSRYVLLTKATRKGTVP